MQNAARIPVIIISIIFVVLILVIWKKNDRRSALSELESRFGADVSVTDDEFYLGCSSPSLVDLTELARVARRAGNPTILDVTGASELKSFAGIEHLKSLTSIVAIDCPSLISAEGVSGHPSLTEIVLTDSGKFSETAAIRDLPELVTLDFSGCLSLTSLEAGGLPKLQNLYLSRCLKVEKVDVSAFPGLRQLYTDGCSGLAGIQGLGGLKQLTDLDVSNATALKGLEGVGGLSELIVLDIRNVEIGDFSEIATLPKLRVLRMGGQDGIESLEPLSGLSSLREIHLEACPNFRSLRGIPSGVSQYAGFTHCPELRSLDGLEAATGLEQLDLTGCANLSEIGKVSALGNLVQLSLVKCRQVADIKAVEKLPKLVIVMLGGSGVVPASVEELSLTNKEMIFDFAVSE